MGAGYLFGMKPPVIACGKLEGKLVILEIILTHIDMKAVPGEIVEGAAFFLPRALFVLAFSDVAGFIKLPPYLCKIGFVFRYGKCILDGCKMLYRRACVCKLYVKSLFGAL